VLYQPVPLLIHSDILARRVEHALASRLLPAIRLNVDITRAESGGGLGVCVIEEGVLDGAALRRLIRPRGRGVTTVHPIFLVADPMVPPLEPVSSICVVSVDLMDLPAMVFQARLKVWKERLACAVRSARHVPLLLQDALVLVLRHPVPRFGEGGTAIRNVTELAARVGVSREHLSRTATQRRIALGHLTRSHLTVMASYSREVERHSWDAVAWSLGYASQAGLSKLARATTGLGLREIERRGVGFLMRWWEMDVLGELLDQPQRRNT
jgi:hypothetical protein